MFSPSESSSQTDSLPLWQVLNDTAAPYPREARVDHLFAQQVAQTPTAVALEFDGNTLTYEALDARSNQLARLLQSHGIGPDVCVGIYLERSPLFLISILGILKAGGAYVPLDPSYPDGRLAVMLEEARARVLLTQTTLADKRPHPGAATVVVLDRSPDPLASVSPAPVSSGATADSLAYVLFTSGSTGRPKGVAMPHRPLVNLLCWQCDRSTLGVGDRTLQFSALSFDVSFQEIFSTWCSGGTLVLVSETTRRDTLALLRLLDDAQIQRLFLPFVSLQHIANMAVAKGLFPRALTSVITAGEQLQTGPSLRSFFRRLPGCTLENQYGPTESHVVTAYRLPTDVDAWDTLPPIGRPIANARVYLLDDNQRPVPPDEAGELYIGGDGLARGYLHRPDLTQERFLTDPFADAPDARLYRTGDLARYRPDGTIDFLGRADHQVKVRGYRVELGEIEAVLSGHADVREAIVVPDRGDTQGNQALVAYVVPRPGVSLDIPALQAALHEQLPAYMVPSALVAIDALPTTPSGKVDRKALSAREVSPLQANRPPLVPPRDELETMLVDLWEETLDIRPLGIHDDFFALGGHSLLAAEMFVKLSALVGRDLPLALMADASAIAPLATKLRQHDDRAAWSVLVPIQPHGDKPPLFCVHGGGVNVLRFRSLSRALGDDQPVYGLQWGGLDGRRMPSRIEALADDYLAAIRTVRPHGPYGLAGQCFGGLVAYEMAQRLRADGESVPLLLLFDTPHPAADAYASHAPFHGVRTRLASALTQPRHLWHRVRSRLALRTRLDGWRARLAGRPPSPDLHQRLAQLRGRSGLFWLWSRFRLALGKRLPVEVRSRYALRTMEKALGAYRPRPYAGSTVLFHSGDDAISGMPPGRFTDGMLGWSSSPATPLHYHRVPAGHTEIVDHPETIDLLRSILSDLPTTAKD